MTKKSPHYFSITSPQNTEISFLGPPISEGPLPTVLYFSLSGKDSLTLSPYNTPATLLSNHPIRIISFSLPNHKTYDEAKQALIVWADLINNGKDIFSPFIESCQNDISYLQKEGILPTSNIAVMGLSRGCYFAINIASQCDAISHVLGFSPLLDFTVIPEFPSINSSSLLQKLSVENFLNDKLLSKTIKFYIGNNDTKVGTATTLKIFNLIIEKAQTAKVKSITTELTLYPSIGAYGHGTPNYIFEKGAAHLKDLILPQ
jgi:hypothetical protein